MLLMGKSTISMAIFHCYVSSPEGISHEIPLNPIKPPFSYGFPMGFPMVFLKIELGYLKKWMAYPK